MLDSLLGGAPSRSSEGAPHLPRCSFLPHVRSPCLLEGRTLRKLPGRVGQRKEGRKQSPGPPSQPCVLHQGSLWSDTAQAGWGWGVTDHGPHR